MYEIQARNVNEAMHYGIKLFKEHENSIKVIRVAPRGVETLEWHEPVATVHHYPRERVLLYGQRDANPFLHFFGALWMLAGRNDVEFMAEFSPRLREFSDDGTILHGAYGFRWRNAWHDQLKTLIELMKSDPNTRRAVLVMWAPNESTLYKTSKDQPCNTHVYFSLRTGILRMTVCCRSNDMIWGAYGTDSVDFSTLHEYMANKLGATVGEMTQISNSFHVYRPPHPSGKVWQRLSDGFQEIDTFSIYRNGIVKPYPLGAETPAWDTDLEQFFKQYDSDVQALAPPRTNYFRFVVHPLWYAWLHRHKASAREHVSLIAADDWRLAATNWLLAHPVKK